VKPARTPLRRSHAGLLIRAVSAAALLSLAVVPAWGLRHIHLDGLADADSLSPPKLLLSAVHL
jgi:hypothetical protein